MIKRVTITINNELLKKIDSMIDGVYIRNRSHAIEQLIRDANIGIDTGVILAGGKIDTDIKINGKPLIEYQVAMLRQNGLKRIIVAGAKSDNTEYVEEKTPLGTAGAIKNLHLKKRFLVLHLDTLMKPDISAMANFHFQNNSVATILLTTTNNPKNVGAVEMQGSVVTAFREKPAGLSSSLMNAGLYIMEPDIVKYIPNTPSSLERDVFPKLAKKGLMSGYIFNGDVVDIRRK